MRWPPTRSIPLLVISCGVLAAMSATGALSVGDKGEPVPAASVRVIDGDTVAIGSERVRLSNLDSPEMPGRAKCPYEGRQAVAARERLSQVIHAPGAVITLHRDSKRSRDRYGRTLARLAVGGVDVADGLIAEGLARPWKGRSSDWCGAG